MECLREDMLCHIVKPSCTFSRIPALVRTPRCREVALNESPISPAMSPTEDLPTCLRYFRIASRRLLARALRFRSSSFMLVIFNALIRPNMPIRNREAFILPQTTRSRIPRWLFSELRRRKFRRRIQLLSWATTCGRRKSCR